MDYETSGKILTIKGISKSGASGSGGVSMVLQAWLGGGVVGRRMDVSGRDRYQKGKGREV